MDQPYQVTASTQHQTTAPSPTLFIGLGFHLFCLPAIPSHANLPPPLLGFHRQMTWWPDLADAWVNQATPGMQWCSVILQLTIIPHRHLARLPLGFHRRGCNTQIPLPARWVFPQRWLRMGVPWRIGGGSCNNGDDDYRCHDGDYGRGS
jgi:hypothetical protein